MRAAKRNDPGHGRAASTVKEFCERYRIGHSKFNLEVAAGRLRTVKIGGATRVLIGDEMAWANALPRSAPPGKR